MTAHCLACVSDGASLHGLTLVPLALEKGRPGDGA